MSTTQSLKNYLNHYYSDLLLISIIFLFFLELISDFVEAIYAICLLTLSLNENVLSVLFLFSPVLLLFFQKSFSDRLLVIAGELMIVCRVLEALLVEVPQGKMLVSGIGVASFLVFFPAFLQRKYQQNEEESSITLGLGLAFALSLSIFFRTLGSTVDISTSNWFQMIGWVLAAVAGILMFGLITQKQEDAMIDSTNREQSSTSTWRTIGLCLGLTSILMMIYYSFTSPTVFSRWTEGNYFFILLVITLMITIFFVILAFKHELLNNIKPWIIWLWNVLFLISLVLTIMVNQLPFPLSEDNYPIYAPTTTILHQFLLILMLILFPIILLDFTLLSRELFDIKPTIRQLSGSFSLSSLFFLIMIFTHVFTTVYDYIDIVGPFFRDMFWFVYLIVGLGVTLPVLLIKQMSLKFKPISRFEVKILTIILIFITIGTLLAVNFTTPIPTTPETTTSMRVMTYNIQQGYSENGIKNFDGQLNVIREVDPDIIGLQECDSSRIAGGNTDVVRYFANTLKMYSYYGPKTVTGTFGIALLSKYPIENTKTFFMYSKGEQTATIEAQIKVQDTLFNVYVTHLGNGGPIVQQEAIIKVVKDKSNVILLGDFNFEPNEPQYDFTTEIFNDSWLVAGAGASVSYLDETEFDVNERIDHVFVSEGTNVIVCNYIVSRESDHPALWVEIGV
ncbi:MAG: endonuclease/exonuclease/phosphatase family protein [Candidatus Heimdallarchaeota archaeon]|nr:MAG: endonuclease/exonuclease/phosphatase family protein [Candidatus Heimdallarchaeota archaeon]